MKKNLMSFSESMISARNINVIEKALGHKIPDGIIDYSEFSGELLSFSDSVKIAQNIREIEKIRNRRNSTTYYSDLGDGYYNFVIIAVLATIVLGALISLFG